MSLNEIEILYSCQPTPSIILNIDSPDFSVAAINPAFLHATDTLQAQMIGKDFFDVFPINQELPESAAEKIKEALNQSLLSKKSFEIQDYTFSIPSCTCHHEGTDTLHWKLDTYPLLNENGEITYLVLSLTDITLQITAEGHIAGHENAQELALQVQQRNLDLFNFSPVPTWVYDTNTLCFLAANEAAQNDYGYTLDEFLSSTLKLLSPAEDLAIVQEQIDNKVKRGLPNKITLRHILKSGKIIKVEIESKPLPSWGENARIIMALDVTANVITNNLEHLEKSVLELNAKRDVSLSKVLCYYVTGIEALFPEMLCSIMKIKNGKMYSWATPSLPVKYIQDIEGLAIGNNVGSCGSSAFLKKEVIASDIANDPRWLDIKEIALASGLKACWSYPIISSENEVLATFGIYYKEIKEPDEVQLKIIERAAALLMVILENRQYAKELKETTQLMVQGQELARFGNWSWDIQNNVVSWSAVLYTIYGLNKDTFKATFEGYQEMLHPDDKERVYNIIQNVLINREDVEFEERIIRPDGEVRHLKSWATLKYDELENPVKMIGACLDITESKNTQEALITSEQRFKTLIQDGADLIAIFDADINYQYVSANAKRILGIDPDRLIGKNVFDFIHHQDRKMVMSEFARLDTQKRVELSPFRYINGSGQIRWAETIVTDLRDNPAIAGITANSRDITARMENELKTKEHLERYNIMSRATSDAVWDLNISTGEIIWNHGIMGIFGYKEINQPYQWWHDHVHPEDISKVTAIVQHNVDQKIPRWTCEYRFRSADGSYKDVLDRGFLIFDKEGSPVRMIGAIQDITERINYIHEIERHNLHLREIKWAQAHLVRGPLARIMAIVELLKDPETDHPTLQTLLSYMNISAHELDKVIQGTIRNKPSS